MKAALLLLATLGVLVPGLSAAVVKAPAARSNLNVGYISAGDRLLHRQYLYQQPYPNTVQYQDMVYRGNVTTRISAVQVTEVGYTQYATAWIISGGIGWNNVTVRAQSARGYGFYYLVDVWGR